MIVTVGPVPSNPIWDLVTSTTWAWSLDNLVKISIAIVVVIFAAETVGPLRNLLYSFGSLSKGVST